MTNMTLEELNALTLEEWEQRHAETVELMKQHRERMQRYHEATPKQFERQAERASQEGREQIERAVERISQEVRAAAGFSESDESRTSPANSASRKPSRQTLFVTYLEHSVEHAQPRTPPRRAKKLLSLIPDKMVRRTSIGDLEEEFPLIADEHGNRFATRWYMWQACCIMVTYIGRQLRKALIPAAMLERLIRALLK